MDTNRTARTLRVAADANVGEAEIARLLSQHFGDGLVYIAEKSQRRILRQAMAHGLISADGQLTAAGYRLLKHHMRD